MKTIARRHQDRIEVAVGSITDFEGDALVNAANSSLLGGGGVDGAIHAAAGPELLAECKGLRESSLREGLPTGMAVATGAGKLSVRAVIHTVGPVWHGGSRGEPELLSSCYTECLTLAQNRGFHSVAFPAISTGVYGYPKQEAARISYKAIEKFLADNALPERIILIFYSERDAELFLSAIGKGS
jgi:O-acetyl-ADP-ribose deacetylase